MDDSSLAQKAKSELKQTKHATVSQMITLVNGAFALIAALAWNEAVKAFIDHFFPTGSGVYSKFLYAIFITVLVVFVTRRLSLFAERLDKKGNETK